MINSNAADVCVCNVLDSFPVLDSVYKINQSNIVQRAVMKVI